MDKHNNKNILTLSDVSLIYHTKGEEVHALHDLNFSVNAGEFIAIVGPSGCGKTTILSIINGLISPSTGDVFINNEPVSAKTNKTAYMLQKDCLFSWRTILQNTMLPYEIAGNNSEKNKTFVLDLIQKYDLSEFVNSYPHQLSGGMRQRAALIRTLAQNPEILLLDEPFSALDFQTRLKVCDDVWKIIKEQKKTAILVTHDISEAVSIADKIIVLSKRPATIKATFETTLNKTDLPGKRREDPSFSEMYNKIWKELKFNEN